MSNELYVPLRSKALAGAMEVFMGNNFKPWSVLIGEPNHNDRVAPPAREPERPRCITIWYSCMDPEREYAWTMAHWMAAKAGRKTYFPSLSESFPYVLYDGFEAFPVVPEDFVCPEEGKEKWGYLPYRDALGCVMRDDEPMTRLRASQDPFSAQWVSLIDQGRAIIKNEILRLDELWTAQFNPKPWVV